MYVVPGPVSNLLVSALSESSLAIAWNSPERPNGILVGYTVTLSTGQEENINPSTTVLRIDSLGKPITLQL